GPSCRRRSAAAARAGGPARAGPWRQPPCGAPERRPLRLLVHKTGDVASALQDQKRPRQRSPEDALFPPEGRVAGGGGAGAARRRRGVERARRAAVEALRRLEREDQLGRVRVRDAEHQSGEKHIVWHTGRKLWRVSFMINNGPDKGRMARPEFLPKDESPEEVERARRAAVEALRRLEEEDQLGRARARDRAEHQSGEEHIVWEKGRKAWRVYFMIENGPDKGRQKTPCFRPRDESPEEVEQARRAAVEALRRLEREDQLGRARGGNPRAERQSGVQNVHWHTGRETWRLRYRIKNGPDKGRQKTPSFRPKDESPEEVERARRAAVEALRRLEEADGALGPGN
ncbi:unnamed protein product, partial [Prorocentrum cordatum]